MVSPELVRHPFFGFLDDAQLQTVAAVAEEVRLKKGDDILRVGNPAESLYFLLEGRAELYYVIEDPNDPLLQKDCYITDLNPGEIFGISAMLDEPLYNGTVHALTACRVLKLSAPRLRTQAEADCAFGYGLMREIARAAMQRLHYTRLQLATAIVEASDTY
jgi:CRP/FNR family transcriptional regulator, cyclic AMP receptor protein